MKFCRTKRIGQKRKAVMQLCVLLWAFIAVAQDNMQPVFQEGNDAYNAGDYAKAAHLYEQVLKMGQHSAALYYNLGNTHYRLNNVAESIFYYEKAKQLDPNNDDLLVNSAFAENMKIDAIEPLPVSQLAQWKRAVLGLFSLEGWAVLSILLAWLLVLFLGAYWWIHRSLWKRVFFSLTLLSLLLLLSSYLVASMIEHQNNNTQYAILFSEQINIRSEPNDRSDILFVLHKGTKVQITDVLQDWQEITIANGATGWIKNAQLRKLN
jgi:tetratricopeptide (TPR) repeat protein